MNSHRKTAIAVGSLFIIATVAGVVSLPFLNPILDDADYLAKLDDNQIRVVVGALFELILAVSVAGIAIAAYPVLKQHSPSLALGYVAARILEGVLFAVGVLSLLVLLTLSREFAEADTPGTSQFETSGTLLLAARDWAHNAIIPTFAFGLSMVIFYYLLYQSVLVPRWLSVWGLVGMPLYIAAGFSAMFREGEMSTIWNLLVLPIAVNEMVLAVWLIVKGFEPSAIASLSAESATT